jgi:hypothetical protein
MKIAAYNSAMNSIKNELAQKNDDQVIYATLGSEQKCDNSL